ncbi:exodeoxyribonuclease VII large subunit [Lactococcus nasutitermitis]|uniref:Exodeoxyribonuclease 7 large subunit n=1 Tax=Lactococcus nasutitermitis TaxID=1652957 RepID=A0ABV9JDH2_9LACT|nr:exodeoxyribonuclease VII large subunit [Lactococcus nasutitermitis]
MAEYLTVSTLTKYLKAKFDRDPYLERVYLQGEVSNFRQGQYFYQYFSLKDEKATIGAQMPTRDFQQLNFTFENTLKVLCIGRVSLNDKRNQVTFTVEKIIPDGVGELALRLEELKKRLTAEGLFAENHKQAIPQFSKRIAVITASSGAVIHDIITTVDKRFPLSDVVLFASKVSGPGSVEQLVARIEEVNRREDIDLLIIGRGGGSIEDLWSFNEEAVVRAIYNSQVPVISSVGHETDTTLADFVADVRAATPTAAATFATPNTKADLLAWLGEQEVRQQRALSNVIVNFQERVDKLSHSVIFRQPERLYDGFVQKVDYLTERLSSLTEQKLGQNEHRYELASDKLLPAFAKIVENRRNRVDNLYQSLLLLDISKIKARGFAIVTKSDGKIVKSVKDVETGELIALELGDGKVSAEIK